LSITPHAAFYSQAGYRDMRTFSAQVLKAWLVDGTLLNNVNPDWVRR
jgi:D-3-phosphoglycerate dehydrogenase